MENELLTAKQIAQRYGISNTRAYDFIREKGIPYMRLSERRIRVRKTDLYEWEAKNKTVGYG